MQFRTTIKLKEAKFKVDIKDRILLLGSCFSEHIGNRLKSIKWNCFENPHGILFNPASIHNCIKEIAESRVYKKEDLIFSNELWYSWQHHGKFADTVPDELLTMINNKIVEANTFLKTTEICIITLGSAWVYKHIEKNIIVANCHKVPQKEFNKTLLSVNEIVALLSESVYSLRKLNPEIKVVFTLSPVRYLKDGFTENALSKAHLLTAIHEVSDVDNNIEYFPAYEIFMDDLRDYRFNTVDLVHPNDQAIDYIWEKFIEFMINDSSKQIIKELSNWRKQMDHRPFHTETEEYRVFREKLLKVTEELQRRFPFLNFSDEM
ncbi:MAG TPA: GSCFA domain-containing protein [Saprospiraceae bacterium]|nr:GSCFA domain-containing protein [Saprospiraceae bacterium]